MTGRSERRPKVGADGLLCPVCGTPMIYQTNAKEPNLYWCGSEKRIFRIQEVGASAVSR